MTRGASDPTPEVTEFRDVKKVLVIKFRHIGDVLLTLPAIRALKQTFPGAGISVLVNAGTEDMLTGHKLIDEVIVLDREIKRASAVRRYMKEIGFLAGIKRRGFDMTVDMTGGDRSALVSLVSGARYRLTVDPGKKGFPGKRLIYTHLADIDKQKHMALQNLDVVRQFGIDSDRPAVDFFVPDEIRRSVRDTLAKNDVKQSDTVAHVHPASRWLFKCWKDEYMAEVIRWLINKGIKVVITSAPDDREMEKTKKILSLVSELQTLHISGDSPDSTASPVNPGQSPLDLCGKTTIKELGAVSEASDLFIGVDSAPMHIAAAVNTPVIALFGPTGENVWGPYGKGHIVVSKDLKCKPCIKGMCEGIRLRDCMTAIKPEDVKEAVSKILKVPI